MTPEPLAFSIETETFSGPLELLIELVEKRKLLINDISLAEVTDEYMRHVADMQERSLPHTAQFVALAATLLLIKSKSLLPVLELTKEEEETIEELGEKLRYYQIYRDAAEVVHKQFGTRVLHERLYAPSTDPLFVTDQFTEVAALTDAIRHVVHELPIAPERPRVRVAPVVSLEEMIARLHQRIEQQMKLRFSDLVADSGERKVAVVGFLAILESVKQGSILVSQMHRFSDIEMERSQFGVPGYH